MTERLDAIRARLAAAEARHTAWYNTDATHDATGEAEWLEDLGHVEGYEDHRKASRRQRAMAHEIVREDVPNLAADVRWLLEKLAEAWAAGALHGYRHADKPVTDIWDDNPHR